MESLHFEGNQQAGSSAKIALSMCLKDWHAARRNYLSLTKPFRAPASSRILPLTGIQTTILTRSHIKEVNSFSLMLAQMFCTTHTFLAQWNSLP